MKLLSVLLHCVVVELQKRHFAHQNQQTETDFQKFWAGPVNFEH